MKIENKRWAMIVLAALFVMEIIGGIFGYGAYRKKSETWSRTFDELTVKSQEATVRAETAEAKADSWQRAATSRKRVQVRKTPVDLNGRTEYAWTWDTFEEAATTAGGATSTSSAGATTTTNVASTITGSSGTDSGKKDEVVKPGLRFFAGPAYRIGDGLPADLKRFGITGGGRLAWRFGATASIFANADTNASLLLFF